MKIWILGTTWVRQTQFWTCALLDRALHPNTMYLPHSTIKAILDGLPPHEDKPIQIEGDKQQRQFLEEWRQEVQQAQPNCPAQVTSSYHSKPYLSIQVEINATMHIGRYQSTQEIRLKFIKDILHLSVGYSDKLERPISSLDQVWQIVESIRKKLFDKSARAQKQQKIREIKTRSVEAQVEDLAQRLQFAYQLTRKYTKLVLVVELDKQRALYVDIPLGKIQETFTALETLIREVKQLYMHGLRFKIAQSPYGSFQQPKPVE